jgi:hypothetical protein
VLGLKRRTLASLSVTLAALVAAGDLLLLTARGARAPAWAHWWCSASGLHPASRHGGQAHSLVATLLGCLGTVLPHWPHILPLVVAVTTLVYLWRANAHYHATTTRQAS